MIVQAKDRQTCSRKDIIIIIIIIRMMITMMMLTMGERQHHMTELTWRDFFIGRKEGRGRERKEREVVARFCHLKGGAEHMCTETTQHVKALPV